MNKYRMFKGRLMHVNQIAAISRATSVSNNTIPKTELNQKNYMFSWSKLQLTRFNVGSTYGKLFTYEVDKKGNKTNFQQVETDRSWKEQRNKQPKSLYRACKKKKRGFRSVSMSEFPVIQTGKINHTQYMEKLVQHKLAKWERKNPQPEAMYVEEVEKWKQLRATAEERFRDFVVSIYDKLQLTGRFKTTSTSATYMEEKIAELKDINGDGHRVNEMKNDAPLLKKAIKVTSEIKAKRPNLVAGRLIDHKRKKGRIILPDSELRKAA